MGDIIEVGANSGEDTARLVEGKSNRVFAFEPIPELFARLQNKFSHRDDVYIVPFAGDIEENWRWFNVSTATSGGVSSLYNFNHEVADAWIGQPETLTKRVRVITKRLDNFIVENRIENIDYLWIDAQGNDFRVLQSLGEFISIVTEGKCEASLGGSLYVDTNNDAHTIAEWLSERGFDVAIVPDAAGIEADVHFRRRLGS